MESDPLRVSCRPLGDTSIEAVLKRYAGRFAGETIRHFAVRRVEDDKFIGQVTYFDLNTRNRSAEIGFLIGPEFRGKGHAFESITLLLRYLFDKLELNKAMAQTGEFNSESIAVLTRLGFQQDGRLRQHHTLNDKLYDDLLFSLLKSEYRENVENQ